MPTVVDSLILELSIDPKNFVKGQREAEVAETKTRDSLLRTGKDMEAAGKRTGNAA